MASMIRQMVSTICVAGLLWATAGCSQGPQLVTVEGQVTLDGKPLADASVIFRPAAGGRPSIGRTDEEGRYVLQFTEGQQGALVGSHAVSITTYIEADEDSTDPLIRSGQKETLPPTYNSQTTLRVDLDSSKTSQDFELKSQNS